MKTYKHEVRILASRCKDGICIGLIVRGRGFDGAVAGKNCNELCERLVAKGYIYELRLSSGDCNCGLTSLNINGLHEINLFLEKLLASITSFVWNEKGE
ncbi:MAG: hypothetical protein F7C81_00540 [Desulfurococcales archaeon]|nr:hypothetical protein [Desulfurococcales archaeon]